MADQHQISPEDSRLIEQFFACARCCFALAALRRRPLAEILQWVARPHIQRAIDLISIHQLEGQRAAAIFVLSETLKSAKEPIERRRTACALIRAVTARPTRLAPLHPHDAPPSSLPGRTAHQPAHPEPEPPRAPERPAPESPRASERPRDRRRSAAPAPTLHPDQRAALLPIDECPTPVSSLAISAGAPGARLPARAPP